MALCFVISRMAGAADYMNSGMVVVCACYKTRSPSVCAL